MIGWRMMWINSKCHNIEIAFISEKCVRREHWTGDRRQCVWSMRDGGLGKCIPTHSLVGTEYKLWSFSCMRAIKLWCINTHRCADADIVEVLRAVYHRAAFASFGRFSPFGDAVHVSCPTCFECDFWAAHHAKYVVRMFIDTNHDGISVATNLAIELKWKFRNALNVHLHRRATGVVHCSLATLRKPFSPQKYPKHSRLAL